MKKKVWLQIRSILGESLTEKTVWLLPAPELESHQQMAINILIFKKQINQTAWPPPPPWNTPLKECHIYSIEMFLSASINQSKYLDVALSWSTDKAVLSRIDSQRFDRRVVGLEALTLVLVGELQDTNPALPPTGDKQLLPGGHQKHRSSGFVAAESWGERERGRMGYRGE